MVSPVRVGQPAPGILLRLDTQTTVDDNGTRPMMERRRREDTVSHPDQLELRIDVGPMPAVWCTDPAALSLGLQSGRDDIVRGTALEDGIRFEVSIGVKQGRDGDPDFTGPLVHGRPGERFLYLSWGHVTAHSEHDMFRRSGDSSSTSARCPARSGRRPVSRGRTSSAARSQLRSAARGPTARPTAVRQRCAGNSPTRRSAFCLDSVVYYRV